ncbi:MAG TPA: sigma-70 family RNA polymerase sigma factor [Gemmatimonadaceae bacterium]|jgi:RNA polymerase sigma-70 factor (ECF subfamily)
MADEHDASDARLVHAARLGDAGAFDALVGRYLRSAHALAFAIARNHLDAEDICQDAFVRALEQLDKCRSEARFAGWFFAIVRSTALNHQRRERLRRGEPIEGLDTYSHEDPVAEAERSELRARLGAALAVLGERECSVVLLHDLEGRAHREIANALGISDVSSRQYLFVARQKLRAALADLHAQRTDDD